MIKGFVKKVVNGLLRAYVEKTARDDTGLLPAGPILVIAPHPDDETLGCGATIARWRAQGLRVRVAIVTDGSASSPSAVMSPEILGATRRTEIQKAAKELGIPTEDLIFLSYIDGQTSGAIEKIAQDLAAQIWLCSPALILAPYGIDGHPDHRAVAQALDLLHGAGKISCPVYAYPVWFWPKGALRHLQLPGHRATHRKISTLGYMGQKRAAIAAHRSQFESITGEKDWHTIPPEVTALFLGPYEFFFEKAPAPASSPQK